MARWSKTLTPAAQAAFLAALRGGALVAAAAREAGVALSTLYWRRQRDPAFAAAWEAAAAASEAAPGRRLRFGAARRRRFLLSFEAWCNTHEACRETGVDPATVYRHIARDPGFERGCRRALKRGVAQLERVAAAEEAARVRRWARYEIEPEGEPPADFETAWKLLVRWDRPDGSVGRRFVRHGRMKRWNFDDAIRELARRLQGLEPRWGGKRKGRGR